MFGLAVVHRRRALRKVTDSMAACFRACAWPGLHRDGHGGE